ncbi:heavy metal translocating P-type ATPase [Marinimicrobium sp. ABcell2]|uniref:heavy metal translocating P-type ATPase n=1 Tax=Marinimicrobium sp. ABcell2 TaxID=3069751 RepID=UPI0027ADEBCB|nr:heavy metal translocating P-type ATPase [Marinimicrobium sp. ABcell2]MDQ2078458.1 heavy metal translocating P-type ATPase [Marinimicrobium sp. ABcell2]
MSCYHCGLPIPDRAFYPVTISGREERMCCIGCQAVATAIVDGGLESFYRFRTEANSRPDAEQTLAIERWRVYDLPEVQSEFVLELDEHQRQASLLLENITCAACSWLIEKHLHSQPGVRSVTVNMVTHRCTLVWDADQQPLSELLLELAAIGFTPHPATDKHQQDLLRHENRLALMRLGVAGFGMMQVGMLAVYIYTGATGEWLHFFRWISLLLVTPVVLFSSWPFFRGAWIGLRRNNLTMDVPIALGIGLAYIASAWATVSGGGEVYFEAISTFAFFLLAGRYVEMRARHKNRQGFGNLAQLMPLTARRLDETEETLVPVKSLRPGERVLVRAGETFPCDGRVQTGHSAAMEALLTGESRPVPKTAGDPVIAGTLNSDSPLTVEVVATGAGTRLSAIERLVDQAARDKPWQVALADKVARYFVAAVLVVCSAVFAFWWWYQPDRALWVALSVLVVTCPCALGLAMPTALAAATTNLRQRGFLVARGHVLEGLTRVSRVIFDKTGTLTKGSFVLEEVRLCDSMPREQALAISAALEASANHPLAAAFEPWRGESQATDVRQYTAAGVEGRVEGRRYRLGNNEFAAEILPTQAPPPAPDDKLWLLLCSEEKPLAWFAVADEVRPGALQLVQQLTREGLAVELLSGDRSGAVAELAGVLGIKDFRAGASPEDKLTRLREVQAAGDRVLMMGDGINDVPVLSGADVSVAVASASDLAQTKADSVLLNDNLTTLAAAITLSRRTRRIIAQNLGFSLSYNLLALPLAAAGMVAPWVAALGMTASSLVVVLNAMRLSRGGAGEGVH